MIVLPFYCNLHLIHTFHFHLKYDYSVLKHISPVPSNYRGMKITGNSRHQEAARALGCRVARTHCLSGVRGGSLRRNGTLEETEWGKVEEKQREDMGGGWKVACRAVALGKGPRDHLLRAPVCLLYKFIIFWRSAHLSFHSFQVLSTCSRKQVPIKSEVWFSLHWRRQKEEEERQRPRFPSHAWTWERPDAY